jgi:hypothetical protein
MRKLFFFFLGIGLIPAAPAGVRADDKSDTQKVIDKAIKALGDEARLTQWKAATWKTKGTFHGMGKMGTPIPYTGDWAYQPPDKSRVSLELDFNGQKFTYTSVFNKGKGWLQINAMTMDMDKDYLEEQKEGMHANAVNRLIVLREKGFKFSSPGVSKIDNKEAVGVKVSKDGFRDVTLYFDKDTGLPVKSETRVKNEQGQEVKQETFFSDYKEVNGIKHPGKITIKRDGQLYVEGENSEFKPVEKLDDALFDKP